MTPEKLVQYIKNPSHASAPDTDELWQLVKEYPYFQVARIMLARNLRDKEHEAFPLALRLSAAYAGDRGLLKKLIEGKLEVQNKIQPIQSTESSEPTIAEFQPIETTQKDTEKQTASLEQTENIVIEPVIPQDTIEPSISTNETEEKQQEQQREIHSMLTTEEVLQNAFFDQIRQRLLEAPIEEDLNIGSEKAPSNEVFSENKKPSIQSELIDKFIREEPRISTPRKEFFSPEDIAKQSTFLPNDIVTETLAVVYEQQGHYNTAIKIYERLMLLFPEKNRYFAGRIDDIQRKRK